jgi:hypothetical protein
VSGEVGETFWTALQRSVGGAVGLLHVGVQGAVVIEFNG